MIGKSLCLHYMLLYCLTQKQPVFFQPSADHVHYFDENGVHSVVYRGADSELLNSALQTSWALIDVDSCSWELDAGDWLFSAAVIVMSSAHPSPQRTLLKQYHGVTWTMQPWSQDELVMEGCVSSCYFFKRICSDQ